MIKVINALLALSLAVALARALGPVGYGTYAYVFALVSVLAVPAQFGLPRLVIRETAEARVKEAWGLMRGVWRWSTAAAFTLSIALATIAALVAWVWADRFSSLQLATLWYGLVLVPLIALGNLRGAALQGLRRVVLGQLPEFVLRPGLFLILLFAVVGWMGGGFSSAQAMALHAFAAGTAFIIGAYLLWRYRPSQLKTEPVPVYETRRWVTAALPMALTAGMQQINKSTDIIMLGFFVAPEDVGAYRVAVQGALFVVFGLQVVAMFIAPYLAGLHASGDLIRLQRLVTLGARIAFLTSLPAVLIFAIWGDTVIRLFFGAGYSAAHVPLVILGFGQLINAFFGHVGILLTMTGYERDTTRGVAIAAVLNISLNYALIPLMGLNGAAIASAAAFLVWNLLLWRDARRRLGVDSMALPFRRRSAIRT